YLVAFLSGHVTHHHAPPPSTASRLTINRLTTSHRWSLINNRGRCVTARSRLCLKIPACKSKSSPAQKGSSAQELSVNVTVTHGMASQSTEFISLFAGGGHHQLMATFPLWISTIIIFRPGRGLGYTSNTILPLMMSSSDRCLAFRSRNIPTN